MTKNTGLADSPFFAPSRPPEEAATHRFTLQEKESLADMIYAYKRQGMKTSENEITRIAINYLIRDYEEHGENSVLHQVLQALHT